MPEEDDISTMLITKLEWLAPVATVDDLPTDGVKEGAYCFVAPDGEEEVWQYQSGKWIRVDML